MSKVKFIIIGFILTIISSSSAESECYFQSSRYWAITGSFEFDDSISNEKFVTLENENGRFVDGVVVNNELYNFRDEHPIEIVKKTDSYCRMLVPKTDGHQGYFFLSPFSPDPEFFTDVAWIRFECGWAPKCAFKE